MWPGSSFLLELASIFFRPTNWTVEFGSILVFVISITSALYDINAFSSVALQEVDPICMWLATMEQKMGKIYYI